VVTGTSSEAVAAAPPVSTARRENEDMLELVRG